MRNKLIGLAIDVVDRLESDISNQNGGKSVTWFDLLKFVVQVGLLVYLLETH